MQRNLAFWGRLNYPLACSLRHSHQRFHPIFLFHPRNGHSQNRSAHQSNLMNFKELKAKSPADLLAYAEELEIENASTLRKQDIFFAILKRLAENSVAIFGDGVIEVLQDGFGFLRSPEANYLPGPDDIYVSPSQVRRFSLRTGDTVEGQIRSPKEG